MVGADWRSMFIRTLIYLPCNIAGYILSTSFGGKGLYGFEHWGDSFWYFAGSLPLAIFLLCLFYVLEAKLLNWFRAYILSA
jgi:hypothetical protein